MTLVDWAARWNPVPDEPPVRVWLPAQRTKTTPVVREDAAWATRAPRTITLTLGQEADDVPLWLPRLLAETDVRTGDRVTVDLADLQSLHLTGLELLLIVLWRRVGPHGEVLLSGGSPGLRAQLDSLDLSPATCRVAVHGALPPPTSTWMAAPCPAPPVPQQRSPRGSASPARAGTAGSR